MNITFRRFAAVPDSRWNFLTLGTDIAFFNLGLSISSAYIILPLFVHQLTNANWLVALIPALRMVGLLAPQLLIAGMIERRALVKPIFLRVTLLERIPYLILAVSVIVLARGHDAVLLVIFFLLVTTQATGSGLSFPPWLDLIARTIPDRMRGRFLGGWSGAGSIVGIGGAALASGIIAWLPWPWNYALCFTASFIAVAISFMLLASSREPARPVIYHAPRVEGHILQQSSAWLHSMWTVVRDDPLFQPLLATNALSGMATLGSGLFAVVALRQAHLSAFAVGLEGTVLLLATTFGNFLWGMLGDKAGHRVVLIWGSACGALATGAALMAHDIIMITLVFFLFGLSISAIQLAQLTFVVDFGTPERRPTYIGLSFLLLMPFAAGSPLLGGIIADHWGYAPVFVLSTIFGVAATLAFWLWVRDPHRASTMERKA